MPGEPARIHKGASVTMTPPPVRQAVLPSAPQNVAPVMPRIPGVNDKPATSQVQWKPLIAVIVAALVCAWAFALSLSHRRQADQLSSTPAAHAPIAVPS